MIYAYMKRVEYDTGGNEIGASVVSQDIVDNYEKGLVVIQSMLMKKVKEYVKNARSSTLRQRKMQIDCTDFSSIRLTIGKDLTYIFCLENK